MAEYQNKDDAEYVIPICKESSKHLGQPQLNVGAGRPHSKHQYAHYEYHYSVNHCYSLPLAAAAPRANHTVSSPGSRPGQYVMAVEEP